MWWWEGKQQGGKKEKEKKNPVVYSRLPALQQPRSARITSNTSSLSRKASKAPRQSESLRWGTRRGEEAEHFLLIVTQHFSSLPGLSFLPLLLLVPPGSRQGRTLLSLPGLCGADGARPSPAPLSRAPGQPRAPAAPRVGARRERQEVGRARPCACAAWRGAGHKRAVGAAREKRWDGGRRRREPS